MMGRFTDDVLVTVPAVTRERTPNALRALVAAFPAWPGADKQLELADALELLTGAPNASYSPSDFQTLRGVSKAPPN